MKPLPFFSVVIAVIVVVVNESIEQGPYFNYKYNKNTTICCLNCLDFRIVIEFWSGALNMTNVSDHILAVVNNQSIKYHSIQTTEAFQIVFVGKLLNTNHTIAHISCWPIDRMRSIDLPCVLLWIEQSIICNTWSI